MKIVIYTVPLIAAIFFLCLAIVYHVAIVRKAARTKNIAEITLRSAALWVGIYSFMAFVSFAVRLTLADIKEREIATCLIAAGLPLSILWGWGVYTSVRHAQNPTSSDEGEA